MGINAFDPRKSFLEFSVVLTGFSQFHLQGTGQLSLYFDTIRDIIGEDMFWEVLQTFDQLHLPEKDSDNYESILNDELRSKILGSQKLGPIARNIIKLWYMSTWYPLPQEWRDVFGVREKDILFIPSPQAYPEGLLWPTIGVNPPGAKGPGYGTWSEPPSVSLVEAKSHSA